MFPEVTVHRPRGVLPKMAVQKRTLVDYQPSWLIVAVPALVALRAKRRRSRAQGDEQQQLQLAESGEPAKSRWRRPAQVVVVAVPRVRGRRRSSASEDDAAMSTAVPEDAGELDRS